MNDWQQSLAGAIERVEVRLDRLKRRLGTALGESPGIFIVPYRSYGGGGRLLVQGRVLSNTPIGKPVDGDKLWRNFFNTYRRLESDEIAGACIRARFGEVTGDAVSDEEGFFSFWLQGVDASPAGHWSHVNLRLCGPGAVNGDGAKAIAEVLVPSEQARFGVISDIDDTVMQSYATELIRMAKLTFLGNAHTRLPFPGVAAFYRALQYGAGKGATAPNPLFYVSSSPWNLYDLLVDFFDLRGIPAGPMFLRNWGISRNELLPTKHSGHKLEAIETLFEFYAGMPFILIGDSGQQDPEIYAETVRRHSQRIMAVYIRDVSHDERRDKAVQELAKEVIRAGSTLILAEDTLVMGRHAAENGWIRQDAIEQITREIEEDLSRTK